MVIIIYIRNQNNKFERSYLDYQIIKEYGQLNKWKPKIKEHMHSLVQKSLKACQTDYFDVLFCPHGVAMPEMLENECINEVMLERMHNDVARNLKKAHELNVYDIAMILIILVIMNTLIQLLIKQIMILD